MEVLKDASETRIEAVKTLKSNTKNVVPQYQDYTYEKSVNLSSTISPMKEMKFSQHKIVEESLDNHFKPSPSPVKSMIVFERETATSPIKTRQSRRSR